ncbi:SRPBCC family protein [Streptomyces lydicus]|uniref:Polyketide cyclase n=1 Tax=Streptomyces lydicus TaxID=47763 RepID=A0A1D7VJZ1_9ACTN|nr:SRPBCC family protein [Streptomyces lydicus]AOP47085.1 polyketide cyclase [Streptomyces lydicus]
MAKTGQGSGDSGLDRLREELGEYATAWVGNMAERAGDKLGDVTEQLTDVVSNGGSLGKVASGLLSGQSPLKALVTGKAKDVKENVVEKAKEVFGGGKGKGRSSGTTKVTNIIEVLDVGVPLRTAYDHWTRYDKFSSFTKGVRSVSSSDETASDWKVKVGPSTRGWKATVQEQIPDDRIVWTSDGAKGSTRGAVSFHELAPNLTRIVLVVEYYPSGFFEKTGNIWRAQGRRLRLDFKHFQRYVTLTDKDPEGWRGEVRDGEVVKTHEEAVEEEESEANEEAEEGEENGEGREEYADAEEGYEGDEEVPEEEEEGEEGEEGEGAEEEEGEGEWDEDEEGYAEEEEEE